MASTTNVSPLTARRRLGAELRRLRDQLGMTTEEVGAYLDCHNSTVSRFENAKRACTKRDFERLMELYGVKGPQLSELTTLMVRARQRVAPWWHAYSDVISANYSEFLAYEAEATRCFEHQTLLIPGLLQTKDYAQAVTTESSFAALGPDQVESLVEVRLRRQQRLFEQDALRLQVVITEAAVRLRVGGSQVMKAQLKHLVETSGLDNVSLRIVPFAAGAKGVCTGAFTLFTTGKEENADVAFTESADYTTAFRDEGITLQRLNRRFRSLSAAALSEQESRNLIADIQKELV
ncbi:helix-turn-helix transcriptional regulator [Streptomyces sp. NPDC003077]|uniref:helix-turn-helix domain-containing protein n=1 Tax=Streptomyces sp. NPDC003077 TaxID=3154443 RepID=UPI0033BE3E60